MKHKFIRVTGCHDCGLKEFVREDDSTMTTILSYYYCGESRLKFRKVILTDYINCKTIHPACPLDDWEEPKDNELVEAVSLLCFGIGIVSGGIIGFIIGVLI